MLPAYGWDDLADRCLADGGWTFERPWLDCTKRFVPAESIRPELSERIDELNTERFELERDMMVDIVADHLPEEGLTKTDFGDTEPFSDMPIDKDQFEEFMEWERETKGADARVRKSGSRWYSNE